jgi:hypothetical protein
MESMAESGVERVGLSTYVTVRCCRLSTGRGGQALSNKVGGE